MEAWQKSVLKERSRLIELFLAEIVAQKIRFTYRTDLANKVAQMISSHEYVAWDAYLLRLKDHPEERQPKRRPRGCSASTLLRNENYRSKLDAWWAIHAIDESEKIVATKNISFIAVKLEVGMLKKRLQLYKNRVMTLENQLEESNGHSDSTQTDQAEQVGLSYDAAMAFKGLYLLIKEMQEQVKVHAGELVTSSFAKRTIIPKDIFEPYQNWYTLNEKILGKRSG